MLYYIPGQYEPNTAPSNRMLAVVKGLSELGQESTVLFFQPGRSRIGLFDRFDKVTIENLWRRFYIDLPGIRYICLLVMYFGFAVRIKKEDIVLVSSNAGFWYFVHKIRPKVKIFVEHTEHPEVVGIGGKFLTPSWEEYYKGLREISGMFVITTALKEFFVSKGVSPQRIHIANITVDPSRFMGLKKTVVEKPYIAYCGDASNNKDGVDQLIKSFAIVANQIPDIALYIIGKMPIKDKGGNIKLIKELGLNERVVFTGMISAKLMPQVLINASALALDRPDNKQAKFGFATKIGEYLMAGNPVVVTKVGDFPLFLKDGESALLAEPDNPASFAEKLIQAISNPNESERIGNNGKKVALDSFAYKVVVKGMLDSIGF